ncbi:MAG: FAD-dependent oxidoreductase, partial [Woeseia sp.]
MTDNTPVEVAIVGAGIVGLAAAFRIASQGKSVLLIDKQEPGHGCSYGNAGVIATDSIEPLASWRTLRELPRYFLKRNGPVAIHPRYLLRALPWLARFALAARRFDAGVAALQSLQARSLSAFASLLDDAACSALLQQRGHLLVSEDIASKPAIIKQQRWLDTHGVDSQWLNREQLQALAPDLSQAVHGGLFFPNTAHVSNPYEVCRGLADAFGRAGGRELRANVRHVEPLANGQFVLHTEGQAVTARKLLITAGAESHKLARALGHRAPLDVERGYHLTVTGQLPDLRVPVASYERHTYMTPLNSGLRITGFVEFGGTELPPVAKRFESLRQHLHGLLPAAQWTVTSSWMGGRPSLPDHLPMIGRSARHPNAIFAFGHQHLGLTLSGITAEIASALINNTECPLDIRPFRCDRFDRADSS